MLYLGLFVDGFGVKLILQSISNALKLNIDIFFDYSPTHLSCLLICFKLGGFFVSSLPNWVDF